MLEKKEERLASSKKHKEKTANVKYVYLDKFERFKDILMKEADHSDKTLKNLSKQVQVLREQTRANTKFIMWSIGINILLFIILFLIF